MVRILLYGPPFVGKLTLIDTFREMAAKALDIEPPLTLNLCCQIHAKDLRLS